MEFIISQTNPKKKGRTIICALFNDAKITCGDDFVQEENNEVEQFDPSMNLGFNLENIMNLDDLSQSFGPNHSQRLTIINLGDSFKFTTLVKCNKQPTIGTIPTQRSIRIKRKHTLVFMPVTNAIEKIARFFWT
jgi:hypothetical protein